MNVKGLGQNKQYYSLLLGPSLRGFIVHSYDTQVAQSTRTIIF